MTNGIDKARFRGLAALLGSGVARVAALIAMLALAGPALSDSADCQRLRQQISEAGNSSGAAQYQAAAERQAAEIERMSAYARSIGCENKRFLFFRSEPPAQCAQINGQLERMRGNLGDLRARSGGGRAELVARYNSQCVTSPAQKGGGLFDSLFGNHDNGGVKTEDVTVEPVSPPDGQLANPGEARAGSLAVCVRTCDGSFFPVSYSASSGRLPDLDAMCHALCPNTDVSVFTFPSGGEIEQAVSSTGQRYMDSPNALKYRQSFDSSCTCRRRGQSWAEALAGAEARLGPENKGDIIVTPQKSAEMARPKVDDKPADSTKTDPKGKNAKTPKNAKATATPTASPSMDAAGVDASLSAQAATISRETTGIAAGAESIAKPVAKDQGQTVEQTSPDGVKRRVRIIDPSL